TNYQINPIITSTKPLTSVSSVPGVVRIHYNFFLHTDKKCVLCSEEKARKLAFSIKSKNLSQDSCNFRKKGL
ncbi:MAG: hypothetical protein ACK4YS_01820, partial [Aphanizomenon sp.]